MLKVRSLAVFALVLLCLSLPAAAAAHYDDFDGAALDSTRWQLLPASPPATLHFNRPGQLGLEHNGSAELVATAPIGTEAVVEISLTSLETPGATNFRFGLRNPETGDNLYIRYNRNQRIYVVEHVAGESESPLVDLREPIGNLNSHPAFKLRIQRKGNDYEVAFAVEGGDFGPPVTFSSEIIGAQAQVFIMLQGSRAGTAWIDYVDIR